MYRRFMTNTQHSTIKHFKNKTKQKRHAHSIFLQMNLSNENDALQRMNLENIHKTKTKT
jgi:hypothetical protein